MGRASTATATLPHGAASALATFGENLRIARRRRGESLRSWAGRLDVSVPTLRRMEQGDPTVGIGVYVTALWACGLDQALADLAKPASDMEATEIEVARVSGTR